MEKAVQDILRYLTRGKTALNHGEMLRLMVSVAEALKLLLTTKVHSTEQAQVEALLQENLHGIFTFPEVTKICPEPFSYAKGAEKQLLIKLIPLIKKVHAAGKNESREALKVRKLNIDEAIAHGRHALAGGKVEEAKKYFRQATHLHVDENAMYMIIADIFQEAGAYKESFEYLRFALMKDPGNRKACDMVVTAAMKIGNTDRGLLLLKKVQEKTKVTSRLLFAQGRLLAHKKQNETAIQLVEQSLEMDPMLIEAKTFLRKLTGKKAAV